MSSSAVLEYPPRFLLSLDMVPSTTFSETWPFVAAIAAAAVCEGEGTGSGADRTVSDG